MKTPRKHDKKHLFLYNQINKCDTHRTVSFYAFSIRSPQLTLGLHLRQKRLKNVSTIEKEFK